MQEFVGEDARIELTAEEFGERLLLGKRVGHLQVVEGDRGLARRLGKGEQVELQGAVHRVDAEGAADLLAVVAAQGHGLLRRAAAVGKPIVAHCEAEELLCGGYIHDGEYCRAHGHKGISSESEWRQVERDLRLVAETGCRYHVCHVSTKESVELVRQAKAAGLAVSCETAPHYLLLCDEDLQEEGRWKMNPPLRSRADRAALVEGIQDGTIEVIATDHAPHSAEEKSRGLEKSAMGVVGLETAFSALYTHFRVL